MDGGGIMTERNDRFLRACRREPVDVTPIWLMRQAGRYMAEYRALRARYSILEMIKTPELAAEVTLQPIHAFDLDAAIIFADILTLLEAMGLPLDFVSGEGPVLSRPVRRDDDVRALAVPEPDEKLAFTLEAIRRVRRELDGRLPLIGFSGAPFTLACYAIEGGSSREFLHTRRFMYEQSRAWHALMEKLADGITRYLRAQAEAGAQALQLFDSWVGLLGPADYREYVLPHTQNIFEGLRDLDAPLIHFGTGTAGLLPLLREAGGSVIGVDWRIDLDAAWRLVGEEVAVQGNLDPMLLACGAPEQICAQADRILAQAAGRPGHVFNLGHGILKITPPEHVAALIDHVHKKRLRGATTE